jgi:hypothetical protein
MNKAIVHNAGTYILVVAELACSLGKTRAQRLFLAATLARVRDTGVRTGCAASRKNIIRHTFTGVPSPAVSDSVSDKPAISSRPMSLPTLMTGCTLLVLQHELWARRHHTASRRTLTAWHVQN